MRILIGAALIALTVSVQAQSLTPEQQMSAQQRAIEQRRAMIHTCQVAKQTDTRNHAGTPQQIEANYQKCLNYADEYYKRMLASIGFGTPTECTRPDGCAVPPGGCKADPKKPSPPACHAAPGDDACLRRQ